MARFQFALVSLLFFAWGFITCLNDLLIPHFKSVFKLNYLQSSLVQFTFFGAYFFGSLIYFLLAQTRMDPISRLGYRSGIVLGLLHAGTGTLIFLPASLAAELPLFLTGLMMLAFGFTLLQISANPLVTILGTGEQAAQRLNLAQAINSLGTTLAPIFGGGIIFISERPVSSDLFNPYLILSILLLFMTLLFLIFRLPEPHRESKRKEIDRLQVRQHPLLMLGIPAIFCYVGCEVSIGSYLSNYAQLPEMGAHSLEGSTAFVSLYWGSLMIGRFAASTGLFSKTGLPRGLLTFLLPALVFSFLLFIFSLKGFAWRTYLPYLPFIILFSAILSLIRHDISKTLISFSIFSAFFLLAGAFLNHSYALYCIVAVGLFNSVMWPHIFSAAIHGLGNKTSQGSALLVMAILGGAIFPPIQGYLADRLDLRLSYLFPIAGYLYLAYYGSVIQKFKNA